MVNIKQSLSYILLAILLMGGSPKVAEASGAVPVNWPQNSISWDQLQGVFNQHPGVNQFHIQFPNHATWDVDSGRMQAYYEQYKREATSLGYSKIPGLSFSSLHGAGVNAGALTVPIQNATNQLEQMAPALRNLRYQQLSIDGLPEPIKRGALWAYNATMNGFGILWDTFKSWFK